MGKLGRRRYCRDRRRRGGRASRRSGENDGGVGALCLGMGFDPAALAACDRGHRLDRRLVLLHAPRRRLAQNAGHEGGRRRRLLAGARRRLLRNEQIHARPGASCPITWSGTSGRPTGPGSPASACCAGSITAGRASSSSIRRSCRSAPCRRRRSASRRWRSAGSSTICCASRRSPRTTRCWRWSASATSC